MIAVQDIVEDMEFLLDAEGNDYYTFDQDFNPAISNSMRWIISVVNRSLGAKKFGEEIFRELHKARVFETSVDSRISLDVFPDDVWTITAVLPNPVTKFRDNLPFPPAFPPSDPSQSQLLAFKYHVSSEDSADRLTVEEWSKNKNNPFADGYDGDAYCDELKTYAYLGPLDYNPNASSDISREIEIRPSLSKQEVTVMYVKVPAFPTQITDIIELPESYQSMLVQKALQYISYKQGDQTNLFATTSSDIQTLLQATT